MVCFRFAIFLLGLLFVTTALWNSTASHRHRHLGQNRDEGELVVKRNAFSHSQMDSRDAAKSAYMRKLMFGGKSMSAKQSSNADTEDETGTKSSVTQKPSGETCEHDHLKKSGGILTGNKNQEPKALECTSFLSPRRSSRSHSTTITRLKHGKHLKTMSAAASFSRTSRKSVHRKAVNQVSTPTSEEDDESEKLLEAAKEMVSLMHRDYKGMGRRKPPVHNNQPRH